MPERFYLDSSIWRDYYENRKDKFRPLGEWALRLIKNIIENKNYILYSDFVIKELKIGYNKEEINKIFEIVNKRNLLIKVNISESQIKESAILCKMNLII